MQVLSPGQKWPHGSRRGPHQTMAAQRLADHCVHGQAEAGEIPHMGTYLLRVSMTIRTRGFPDDKFRDPHARVDVDENKLITIDVSRRSPILASTSCLGQVRV